MRRNRGKNSAIQVASNNIVDGSISAIAARDDTSIVDAAMGAEVLVLIDTSGSMSMRLMGGGTAHSKAANEVAQLQNEFNGKVALFSFSDEVMFCPTGTPVRFDGNTKMAKALDHIHRFDGILKVYLISDGYPSLSNDSDRLMSDRTYHQNVEQEVLASARKFKSPIHTIFIGDETDKKAQRFLQKLAAATGGKYVKADKIAQLYDPTKKLMLADGVTTQ